MGNLKFYPAVYEIGEYGSTRKRPLLFLSFERKFGFCFMAVTNLSIVFQESDFRLSRLLHSGRGKFLFSTLFFF